MGNTTYMHCDLCGELAKRSDFTHDLYAFDLTLFVSKQPIYGDRDYKLSFKGELCPGCRDALVEKLCRAFEAIRSERAAKPVEMKPGRRRKRG